MGQVTFTKTIETETGREVELDLVCWYSPYRPQQGPTYSSGGEPEEPEELELEEIYINGLYLPANHRYYNLIDIDSIAEEYITSQEDNRWQTLRKVITCWLLQQHPLLLKVNYTD